MKETIDFRIDERKACQFVPDDLGVHIGTSVRKIVLKSDDPWIDRLARLDADLRQQGVSLIPSCSYHRRYTDSELAAAPLIRLVPTRWFEPCGEECDTAYDESTACPGCRAGATLVPPLRLRASSIPSGTDVAMTIADEIIFSDALAAVLLFCGVAPSQLDRVEAGASRKGARIWYRPTLDVPTLEIIAPTTAGENPIRGIHPPFGRCPCGDTLGLNLLSELFVQASYTRIQPLYRTRQYFGHRTGLLHPSQKWVVSQSVWQAIRQAKLTGFRGEVVHNML